MKLYPICECKTEEKAVTITNFFNERGNQFNYVFTGNEHKPYLVVSNQEGLKAFEDWTMETLS